MNITDRIGKYIDESYGEQSNRRNTNTKADSSGIVCLDCGKKFKKKITNFSEIKCPKCGSYDTEVE